MIKCWKSQKSRKSGSVVRTLRVAPLEKGVLKMQTVAWRGRPLVPKSGSRVCSDSRNSAACWNQSSVAHQQSRDNASCGAPTEYPVRCPREGGGGGAHGRPGPARQWRVACGPCGRWATAEGHPTGGGPGSVGNARGRRGCGVVLPDINTPCRSPSWTDPSMSACSDIT